MQDNYSKITKSVLEFYRNYPYPYIYSPFSKTHKKLMNKLLRFCCLDETKIKGKTILDAGCGTGEKSIYLAALGARVTALDINEFQLSIAKNYAKKYDGLSVDFIKGDIISKDISKKYDVILCTGVLHHTPSPKKGFSNICRHLKKNGRVIIGMYNFYSRMHYRIIRKILHTICPSNPKKIMNIINHSPFATASQQTLYDRYAVPYESYHTLEEVCGWFDKNNIDIMTIYPQPISNSKIITQLAWAIKGKSFFFVSGEKIS